MEDAESKENCSDVGTAGKESIAWFASKVDEKLRLARGLA
jgi:hypothetical protein